jgi:hypothetical protein
MQKISRMIEPAGYKEKTFYFSTAYYGFNQKAYGHFRACSRSSLRSGLGAQHRPSRCCVFGTLDVLTARAGLPRGVHIVPRSCVRESFLVNPDIRLDATNLGKPIRMRRDDGDIAWFGIGIVQWDILLNSQMQRFFLRRRRCSWVFPDILSRNYVFHDAKWKRHFSF